MYVQGTDNGFELDFNGRGVGYGDVFHRNEVEFRIIILRPPIPIFCSSILKMPKPNACNWLKKAGLAAYDQCMKASHNFNLLDARGVISVTERQAYIGRVRRWPKPAPKHGDNAPKGGGHG